jgi:hypothetical protein
MAVQGNPPKLRRRRARLRRASLRAA